MVRLKRAMESGSIPKELLICGPAGTGKTYAILMLLHTLAADYPDLRILFLRATRVSLTESVLVTFEQEVLAQDGCEYLADGAQRAQRKSYRYPNGSEIVIAGLDRQPTKVLSTSWDIVYWNEAIEGKVESWETLTSRMDRPGRNSRLGWVIADTNPSSPDHWLKKRCDAGDTVLWETTHQANPALHDGNDWTTAGTTYLRRLDKSLSGPRRKRLLGGEWVQGEGIWFDSFDGDVHVTPMAQYQPSVPVYLAIDPGVFTGAVWFQVHDHGEQSVTIFGDYLSEGLSAEANAAAILAKAKSFGIKKHHRVVFDPAGGARNPVGPTVLAEYERCGFKHYDRWPIRPVSDGLELIQSFLGDPARLGVAARTPALFVHPDCKSLRNAFGSYRRAKRAGQWMDYPEDPQHPYEDVMDALRGGLCSVFPDGRKPKPDFAWRRF